jgi:glyoxylase-like metal-dependent hydrolase (beta-lactamase superfamily II)
MWPMITRRTLLHASLAAAVSAAVPALLPRRAAATVRAEPISWARLGRDLWVFGGAGGNVVASGGPKGLLLVDGGTQERSAELLKHIAAESGGRKIETLINTHWHWDHTGSNLALARSGARILAHENTRLWLTQEVISKWEGRTYPPLSAKALPTQTFFYGAHEMSTPNGKIEYGYLPQAHTDGDLYVFFPEANVLVAGDVVSGGSYPIADYCTNGWLGGMISALKLLIGKCDGQTQVVPGSGPVRKKADLQAQLDMCFEVLSKIADNYYKGETWGQLVESQPTRAFDARWGNPDVFLKTGYEGAWLHINEIRRVTR